MKRSYIFAAAALMALSAGAQSFTIYNKNGETIGFNNENIEKIEFSTRTIQEPELTVIDFNEVMTGINPADGIISLTENPLGLGQINISTNGRYSVDSKAGKKIILATPDGKVFEKKADDPGMYTYRNTFEETTDFRYDFDLDGYTVPGIYYLYIPEGTYVDFHDNPLGATSRVYIIETPAPKQTTTITPAPGIVEAIETINLKLDSYPVVEAVLNAKAYVRTGNSTDPVQVLTPAVAADGTITLTLSPVIKAPGFYTISIPAGTFSLRTAEGEKTYMNEEIKFVYEIKGSAQAAPKIGDFYYSDGSWSSVLVDRGDIKPIGVVFYLGEALEYSDSASNYTIKDGSAPMSEFHGYVVALRDATAVHEENGKVTHNDVWWSFWDGNDHGCGGSTNTGDFKGYTNTQCIKARADKDFGGLKNSNDNFPATYYATVSFENECPAPAQSSGWFLPSIAQLKYIYDRAYFDKSDITGIPTACVENSLKELESYNGDPMDARDTYYWSSTEYVDAYQQRFRAYYITFGSNFIHQGGVQWYNKNMEMRVRSVLAF